MSDCLVYWKLFWDEPLEEQQKPRLEWYTNDPYFHGKVNIGDSLWVVVTGGPTRPNEWRLLNRVVIKQLNVAQSKWGKYHAIGDSLKSQRFNILRQDDLSPVLRELDFLSGKKIRGQGRKIGQELQAIRPLSRIGARISENYTSKLLIADGNSPYLIDTRIRETTVEGYSYSVSRRKPHLGNLSHDARQHEILDDEIATIHSYLNGQLINCPSDEKLCDWIHFCYSLELYQEASELFPLIEKSGVNPWYYERSRKIAHVCDQKNK